MIGDAPLIRTLDLRALDAGTVSRFSLELVHDSLSNPVAVPVVVAKGTAPGPVFGLTAAVHGNEVNGIAVIQRLFEGLDASRLRGTIVGVPVVSAYAFLESRRTFFEGFDLNRIMPGHPNGNVGQIYAHRFVERLLSHLDYLIDLHTASFGRVNSLYVRADLRHGASRKMALLQNPEIIVHNEAKDGTLRDAAMERGIPAITVEVGDPLRFQRQMIKDSLEGVRAILGEFGLFEPPRVAPNDEPIVCGRSYWLYAEHGGLLEVRPQTAEFVEEGQTIATVKNPFGDEIARYTAPEAGVVVGRSTNPICATGSRVLHLGIPTSLSEIKISEP